MTDRDEKEIYKQAIKEWMDEQYAKFGRFILGKLVWAGIVAFLLWYVSVRGFKLP